MTEQRRSAIVTGAAQGIGLATAQILADQGVDLCLIDNNADALEEAARDVADRGANAIHRKVDVTDRSEVEAAVAAARDRFGRIDALANIAGGAGPRNLHQINEFEDDDWSLVIDLNLRSTFLACRAVVPVMRAQGYGRIVNMSSSVAQGRTGPVGTAGGRLAYAAAKAGILGFTRQLAKDVGEFGITVNAVMPWLTLSGQGTRIRQKFEALEPETRERILGLSPMKRPAEAEEVAATIAFLTSEQASYVSGVGLPVDGAYL